MRKINQFNGALMLLGGMLIAITESSKAQTVDLTLQNYSSLDLVQVGGTVGGVSMPNAYVGIYSFGVSDVVGITGMPSTIQSICLGPLGDLTTGTYQYTLEPFSQANPGLNPSSWAYSGTQLWGIQNVNYLWSQYNTTANTPTAAAALALALYDALYNSTAYGVTPLAGGKGFTPNFASTAEQTDYDTYINNLNANGTFISNNLANGSVLVPVQTSPGGPSGQSFIILDSLGAKIPPVPEPATIVAASLLLLPFGASAMRGLRNKRRQ
jgi:hypothetical protein